MLGLLPNIALFLTPEITTSLASHYNIDCKSANLTQEVITSLKGENNPNSTIELINQYRKQHNIRPLVHWHDQESNTVEQAESLCQAFLKDTAKKLGETWFLKNRHLFLSEQIIKFMLTELKALIDKKDSVTTKENMLRLINKLPSNFPPEKDQVIEILNKLSFDEQKYLINKCSEKVSGNSIQVLGWDDFEKKVNNNTNENQSIQKISAACIARPSFQNTMSQFAKAYNRRMLKHIQTFHQYKDKKPQIINATFKLLDLDSADLLANIKSDTAQACATLYGKKESFYLAAASNCKFDAFLYPAGDLSSVVDTAMSIAKETYNLESIPFINTTWVDAPLEELPKQEKKDSHPIPMQQDVSANFRFFPSNSSSPPNNVTEHNKHSDSEIHNSNMPSPPQSLPSLQKLPPLCQVRGKTKINFDDFDSVEHIVNLMTAVAQRRYTLDTAALFCPYWLTTDDFVIAGKKMDDWYQNESNQYFTNMASTLYLEQLNLKREKGKRSTSGPPFNKVIKERKDSERKKERSIETLDITKTPSSSSN